MLSNSSRRNKSQKDTFAFGSQATSSSVVVTVRTVPKPKLPTGTAALISKTAVSSPASSSSSTPTPPPRKPIPKRKRDFSPPPSTTAKAVKSEQPLLKKTRSRKNHSVPPVPRPVSRSSQTRRTNHAFGSLEKPIPRSCVISTADGNLPHMTSEDVVLKAIRERGKKGKNGYKAYFRNPANPDDKSFEPDSPDLPVVEIEYPNNGASERFLLLFPCDRDDYQPVREIMKILSTIIECYLTPTQRIPFGSLSSPVVSHIVESRSASPAIGSSPVPETQPLLRTLEKAYHTRNGPAFVRTVNDISARLKALKTEMMDNARQFFDVSISDTSSDNRGATHGGVPVRLWKMIMEEAYQRGVGPDVDDTKKYKSFSSETYGELNPSFVSDIVHRLDLKPGKIFVDLGCGVGNCVLQAALQSGCSAYGIEINHPVAALGFRQETEFHARLRMWGLSAGDVTLREGDFCESHEVGQWITKADVVLVNNYIFGSDLNDALTWRFLDLPEGAKVVVLKPFWPIGRPLTERTADSPEAVLTNVERLQYYTDSVSWTKEPGEFFIYTKTNSRHPLASESSGSASLRPRTTRVSRSSR